MEIEKRIMTANDQIPPSIKEMFDAKSKNYEWETFKYDSPKNYFTYSPSTPINLNSGKIFGQKKNFLDQVQQRKRKIPAPNKYDVKEIIKRPQSGKIDPGTKKIFSEQVEAQSKKQNYPGPGAYFKRPSSATADKTLKWTENSKDHYLNEMEYRSAKIPGVGEYNVTEKRNIQGFLLSHQKNQRKMKKQVQKRNFYNVLMIPGTFEWYKHQKKNTDSNYMGKSQKITKLEKKPAPNHYNLNTNWSKKENIMNMTTMPSAQKSVYYH